MRPRSTARRSGRPPRRRVDGHPRLARHHRRVGLVDVHDLSDSGGSLEDTGGFWGLIFQPAGSVYLDVAAGVTIFVLAGRLFEAKAKLAAGDALRALAHLGAKDVALLHADGTEERVAADQLRAGDTLRGPAGRDDRDRWRRRLRDQRRRRTAR